MSEVSQQIDGLVAYITRRAQRVVETTVQGLYSALVDQSPVDTGRFSSNWQLGVGAPNLQTTAATTVPPLAMPPFQLGQTLFLTNSLPYAKKLDEGSSQQAPAGVVAVTVASFPAHVQQAIARL